MPKSETTFDKLPREIRKMLPDLFGCEFVVLPDDGDFGFEDYLNEKVKLLIKKRKLYTPLKANRLVLRYPTPEMDEVIFRNFFASPEIAIGGGEFQGCFVIDITDYEDKTDSPCFKRLISYVLEHREIHFMFLVFEKDREKIEFMERTLSEYVPLDPVHFTYPSEKLLASYVVTCYSEYLSEAVPEELQGFISKLLLHGHREFGFADRMVKELIDRECGLNQEYIEKCLSELVLREPKTVQERFLGFHA